MIMKRYFLYSIICFIGLTSIVSAKTNLEYDWGVFRGDPLVDANIYKGQLATIQYSESRSGFHLLVSYHVRFFLSMLFLFSIFCINPSGFFYIICPAAPAG